MTPAELFTRCGTLIAGGGPDWKAVLAARLMIRTNSVDNMSKGTSRIPPGIWREIAALLQDIENVLPELKAAALQSADPETNPAPDGMQRR